MMKNDKLETLKEAARLLSLCNADDHDFSDYALNLEFVAMEFCGYKFDHAENRYTSAQNDF